MRSAGRCKSATEQARRSIFALYKVVKFGNDEGILQRQVIFIKRRGEKPLAISHHDTTSPNFRPQQIQSPRKPRNLKFFFLVLTSGYVDSKIQMVGCYMEVRKHFQMQIFLLVGIQLTLLARKSISSEKYFMEPYFEKHDSLVDSDFQNFMTNELRLGLCGMLQDKLNLVPRLSFLDRHIYGEGSHRRLSTSIRLSVQPDPIADQSRHFCKIIIVERLPLGIFADPFELQHLLQRGVFTDAAVFGDTNLELPSVVSNRSVVEVHMDVGPNILSGHSNGMEISIELPLHARYQPVREGGFSRVEFGRPDIFMHCKIEGKSEDQSCLFMPRGNGAESRTHVWWDIPCGMKEHTAFVSTVTFISAVVSAVLVVLASICSGKIFH